MILSVTDLPMSAGTTCLRKSGDEAESQTDELISTVRVDGDTIVEVGSMVEVPDGAKGIDFGPLTIRPGFITAHTPIM